MTCVAGIIAKNGDVHMISDKKGKSEDDVGLYKRGKIFKKDDMIIGYCGSFRVGQVIEVLRNAPGREDLTRNRAYEYIVSKVVPSLIQTLYENEILSYSKSKVNPKISEDGGDFLIAYKGRIFQIQDDFSVLQREEDFNAIGSGSAAAMATLKTLKGQVYSKPKRALKEAIHTAGTYVASVSKECTDVMVLELSDEDKIEREKFKSSKKSKSRIKPQPKKVLYEVAPENKVIGSIAEISTNTSATTTSESTDVTAPQSVVKITGSGGDVISDKESEETASQEAN